MNEPMEEDSEPEEKVPLAEYKVRTIVYSHVA